MVICVFSSASFAENQFTSYNAKIGLNDNVLKVKADYVVTVKKKVKVSYKVRTKVKVKVKVRYKYRYKSHGKWRYKWKTKYKYKYVYKYVYKYYYKYVYTTYKVRDVPPGECKGSTVNAQSSDSRIKSLAQSLTNLTVNETIPNNDSASNTSTELQASKYDNNSDQNSPENSSQYQENITVTRKQTTLEKATNIFNWVRDYVEYSYYFNTKRGAIGTLKERLGNCVDLSHLMVALSRAAGIPARYVHADCVFKSGTIGHVWAQLYVDGKWINADASNNINDFGVIRNWKTYTLKGIYSSLPF